MNGLARIQWDPLIIADLIERAEQGLESEAVLGSRREAYLFRFAIYNYRRDANVGKSLTVTVADRIVRLTKSQVNIEVNGQRNDQGQGI